MQDNEFDCAATTLKALSHPIRLKILSVLSSKALSVRDLADTVGSSQSNVSHHLSNLRDKGMLVSSKDAKNVYYQLRDNRIINMIDMLNHLYCADC